jgi:PAS domain S-box-containing protein
MSPPVSELELFSFSEAASRGQIGLGILDSDLNVAQRVGLLSDWLPEVGEPIFASPLFAHLEPNLVALREDGCEFVLPTMRPSPDAPRVTITVWWNPHGGNYTVLTAPDHAGEQISRLFASDRREKQLLRQQADAASARLRVADALYRDIVESSGYFILRFDVDFTIVYGNREIARFLGLPQEELVGRKLDDLFPAQRKSPWRLDAVAGGGAFFEIAAHDAQGALRWLGWNVRFLGADGGGQFQAVVRDVTAAKRLRVEREKAQEEARAAAVANERLRIAHDLHDTLVRSIVTMITQARLIGKTTNDPETKAALSALDAQARQGLWEAREAIAQTRAARREDKGLRAIAQEFEARSRDIAITIDFDAGALPGDTEQLFIPVLREALRNIELHAGARHAYVALHRSDAGAELVIEDDGAGFDLDTPPPGHFGVTGMRERASLAGATFRIESAPGKGTRIAVFAPAHDKDAR